MVALQLSVHPARGIRYAALHDLRGTGEDVAALKNLLSHPGFEPGLPWLVDNRRSDTMPGVGDVDRLIDFLRFHAPAIGESRIAIVEAGLTGYAMGRVFSACVDDLPVEVRPFCSMNDAADWALGRDGAAHLRTS
jgi:hypothetical protein